MNPPVFTPVEIQKWSHPDVKLNDNCLNYFLAQLKANRKFNGPDFITAVKACVMDPTRAKLLEASVGKIDNFWEKELVELLRLTAAQKKSRDIVIENYASYVSSDKLFVSKNQSLLSKEEQVKFEANQLKKP